jgi:hypothetical protein
VNNERKRTGAPGAPAPPTDRPGPLRWWAVASAAAAGLSGFIATVIADEGDAAKKDGKSDGKQKNGGHHHDRHDRTHGSHKSGHGHDKSGHHGDHANRSGHTHDAQNADAAQNGGHNGGGGGGSNPTPVPGITPPAGALPTPPPGALPTPPVATIGGTSAIPPSNMGGATIQTADGTVIASVAPLNGGAYARSGGVEASTGPGGAKVVIGQVSPINTSPGQPPPSGVQPTPPPTPGAPSGQNPGGGNNTPTAPAS